MENREDVRKRIEALIKKRGYKLNKRFPNGFRDELVKSMGYPIKTIDEILLRIRRSNKATVKKKFVEVKEKNLDHPNYEYCNKSDFIHLAPNKQSNISKTILHFMDRYLPRGGTGIVIGTPTAVCTSPGYSRNNLMMDDEKFVVGLLNLQSDICYIFEGAEVNREKAWQKCLDWKSYFTTHDAKVLVGKVDGAAFREQVEKIAEKGGLCKVILLTSGSWNGGRSSKKYNLDADFKTPAEYLVSKYPNLHILALVSLSPKEFRVRYLHQSINRLLPTDYKKEKWSWPPIVSITPSLKQPAEQFCLGSA
jgi:multimeric flavodoxin WrbA